jgi:ubiquinone/menaquinone biosynthesis C-methylase UbiE
MSGPDPAAARRRYDSMAASYDRSLAPLAWLQERIRRQAVDALQLRAGDTVLDAGCGTGASFPRLVEAVGAQGRIVGVDQSTGMLDVARRRVARAGWKNVDVIEAAVQDAELPRADAAIFFFTHDLLRTHAALDKVIGAVRPGGRVASAGAKRPPAWLAPVGVAARLVMRRYVTTTEGVDAPWSLLSERLSDVTVRSELLGVVYVMTGRKPPGKLAQEPGVNT